MKKNLFFLTLIFSILFISCEKEEIIVTKVVDLETKLTEPESEWIGDKSGSEIQDEWGPIWKNQFSGEDNLFVFDNYFSDFSWGGFMYTNKSDITTAGYTNNSAITGKAHSGKVYLTANTSTNTPAVVSFKDGNSYTVQGFYVTNSTYAYLSMKNGDDFAKKFVEGDWFKLKVSGKDASNNVTQVIEIYLADFRNGKSEMLNTWKWIDLSQLGAISCLDFELSSSDIGDWGMNTPSYFCMDDITVMATIIED